MKTKRALAALLLVAVLFCCACSAWPDVYLEEMRRFFTGGEGAVNVELLDEQSAPNGTGAPAEETDLPASALLAVPKLLQEPELPNGCEVTSLAMALQYVGFAAEKTELADVYLPCEALSYEEGEPYGPDPGDSYVGDPHDQTGYYCLAGVIAVTANRYLAQQGGAYIALNISGAEENALMAHIAADQPVVVWCTKEFAPVEYSENYWYLLTTGELYTPYRNLHCMVLAGYDPTYFFLRDPLSDDLQMVERQMFFDSYTALGQQAVVLEPK